MSSLRSTPPGRSVRVPTLYGVPVALPFAPFRDSGGVSTGSAGRRAGRTSTEGSCRALTRPAGRRGACSPALGPGLRGGVRRAALLVGAAGRRRSGEAPEPVPEQVPLWGPVAHGRGV